MIVDDSAVARSVLSRMLAYHPEFEIVATASTAAEAVDALKRIQVDIVLLDLEMPGGSGLAAIPDILRHGSGARILVVSSSTETGSESAIQALALGAADTLAKPGAVIPGLFSQALVERLRRLVIPEAELGFDPAPQCEIAAETLATPERIGCLAIGASTGGLHAIAAFLRALPTRLGAPLLVTQHLPPLFLPLFARQIEIASGRKVRLAQDGAVVRAEEILVAPGDAHLGLERRGTAVRVHLLREVHETGCMPSVDVMLGAVAETYGRRGVAVVLSGMGRDGLAGSRALAAAGGTILVQDGASSAVWGMPGAVSRAGLAGAIGAPADLGAMVASWADARPCR